MPTSLSRLFILSLVLALLSACSTPEERGAEFAANAAKLFAAGDLARAKVEAQNAVQVTPKNVPARYLLAQIAEQEGQLGQMLGHLEVVIGEDAKHLPSRLKLATILIYAQDYAGAQLLLDQLNRLAPDDPEVRLLQARLLFQKGDRAAGIQALDFVIERQPANAEAALLRGMAYSVDDPERGLADLAASIARVDKQAAKPLRQARIEILNRTGKATEVEAELRALVVDYPDGGYGRDLAAYYAALGRTDDAENALREALKADPDNFDLKFALAQFQSRSLNRPDLAEETLKAFITENPAEQRLPILLGTFYEASNRRDEALAQYQTVIKLDARSEAGYEARARIATLLAADGKRAEARAAYDEILADAPDNVRALTGRGELNQLEQRYDDAVADLRGALRSTPDSETALLALGRVHRARGDLPLAQDAYRRLLAVNPAHIDAATELAFLLQTGGQAEDAEALYRQVLKSQPDNLAAGSGLTEVLLARGNLAAAEAEARRLVALNDPRGVGLLQLGKVLQAREDFPEAATAFRAALGRDPSSELALRGLAGSLTITGQLEQAGREIGSFLKTNPGNVNAEMLLGGNLLRRGRLDEARTLLEKVVAAHPKEARAWVLLASTYPDDPAGREAVLKRGLAAEPRATDLAQLLGSDYMGAGRWDDAIRLFERSLASSAGDASIANNLASLLLDHRQDVASHQRALELSQGFADSRDPAQLDTLGWAHYRLKDYARATQFLERAQGLDPDNAVVQYHLGMAYAASGNTVGARQHLEKALAGGKAGFPGAKEARVTLDRLNAGPQATG